MGKLCTFLIQITSSQLSMRWTYFYPTSQRKKLRLREVVTCLDSYQSPFASIACALNPCEPCEVPTYNSSCGTLGGVSDGGGQGMGHELSKAATVGGADPPGSSPRAWDSLPIPHGPEDPPATTNTLRKLLIGYTCRQWGMG